VYLYVHPHQNGRQQRPFFARALGHGAIPANTQHNEVFDDAHHVPNIHFKQQQTMDTLVAPAAKQKGRDTNLNAPHESRKQLWGNKELRLKEVLICEKRERIN